MHEGDPFMYNFMNMLIFNFIVGVAVCAVIYFYITSNEFKAQLHEKEELNDRLSQRTGTDSYHIPDETITLSGRTKDSLMLKPANFLYIEALGNYVDVHYLDENGKVLRKALRSTIQQMEIEFKAYPVIIRCHRAYIVNISYVEKVNTNHQGLLLILKHVRKEVPVSRTYKKNFRPVLEHSRLFASVP
jgi:DNA-binding LytR/AlgR family response regulator